MTEMRDISTHAVNPCNEQIRIHAADAPGAGGACHEYLVDGPGWEQRIKFQNGPIAEAGVNGTTHEVLLAIVADRLEQFQAGPYSCRENALALTKIQEAMHWLLHRTRARQERGVEGTHEV